VPAAEVIDRSSLEQPRVLCPAGDHRHSVLVDPREVIRIMRLGTAGTMVLDDFALGATLLNRDRVNVLRNADHDDSLRTA
jgi:hypothetical protein